MEYKLYTTAWKKSVNREKREIEAFASKGNIVDRDSEVILPSSWRQPGALDDFLLNPALMLGHDYRKLPIGRVIEVKPKQEGLWFRAKFGSSREATEAFETVSELNLAGFSIGFLPVESREVSVDELRLLGVDTRNLKPDRKVRCFSSVRLLEISLVSLPSCPTCVLQAYEDGKIKSKNLQSALDECLKNEPFEILASDGETFEIIDDSEEEWDEEDMINAMDFWGEDEKLFEQIITKPQPDVTENYIRIRVRDPNSFVKTSFRTITLSAKEGIKAVIGKLKSDPQGSTKVQSYLFDKDKWSVSEAQAWVREHQAGKDLGISQEEVTEITKKVLQEKLNPEDLRSLMEQAIELKFAKLRGKLM